MTLMSNRCTSARPGEEHNLFSSREPPFGVHIPHYFYVYQKKPQTLAPLKAWRGYKGNVYFEPMVIQKVNNNDNASQYFENNDGTNNNTNTTLINNINNNTITTASIPRQQPRAPSRSMLRSAPLPQSRGSNSGLRGLLSSPASSRPYNLISSPSSSQVYVMDKTAVVHAQNANISTDLSFIEGLESTGSLAVTQPGFTRTQSSPTKNIPEVNNNSLFSHNKTIQPNNKDKRLLFKRDRICRGSNFHKSKDKSELGINRNSKVLSIKISDPKKKLVTPDNSRRTSGAGSRMSNSNRKNMTGSANSTHQYRTVTSNPSRSSVLMVSGDKFATSQTKVVSSGHDENEQRHHHFSLTKEEYQDQDRILLDDMDAFINDSDSRPHVNKVHVTLGNMAEEDSLRGLTPLTPTFSDDDDDNQSNDDEDKESVDYVDMNFKGLTTTTTTIPV